MSEKRMVITGATGMVGRCALRACLENPDVSLVTALGRNSTGINDIRCLMRQQYSKGYYDGS